MFNFRFNCAGNNLQFLYCNSAS
ncbi:hypothetical protein NC651_005888 [Populus alba x Populus x berolinensis]|nr:hypothetical protein NC651_005888 [Populus alba x Populus x berolinensis]